jgi:hypothetical protein
MFNAVDTRQGLNKPRSQERLGVESRSGAVTRWFRFQIPLIKPGVRFSRDRLSDKVAYAFAHGRLAIEPAKQNRPKFCFRYWSLKRLWPGLFNWCFLLNHRRSLFRTWLSTAR